MSQAGTLPVTTDIKPLPPGTRGKNKYIPLETLLTLHKKELSTIQIGAIVGCSSENVRVRLHKAGITTLHNYKANRADMFATIQSQLLNNIVPDDIKKASLSQKVIATGILYDKERLERDLSTQNIQPMVSFSNVIDVTPESDASESPTSNDQETVDSKV